MNDKYSMSIGQREKKKPFISNTNYRREMKLEPISMDFCIFQFDDLKFFLEVFGWSLYLTCTNFYLFSLP